MSTPTGLGPAPAPTAVSPLAQGLAFHLRRWAQALGVEPVLAQHIANIGQALALASRQGHVCLPLALAQGPGPALPLQALLDSGLVGTPAAPGACPLIVDADLRVYLQRDFKLEQRLAQRLARALSAPPRPISSALALQVQQAFAPGAASGPDGHGAAPQSTPFDGPASAAGGARAANPSAALDWQQLATALALRQRLVVISGGPGTGKTSTVVTLLACLLAAQPQARVALTAPTGKAAARLAEAVRERAAALPAAVRTRLPQGASTVHRLLGVTPQGFVHHAQRPLALDAVVVDEASMLDLALATQLLEAIPTRALIVLLGDQHQLAAVESGAVFAELAAQRCFSADCSRALEAACALPPGSVSVGLTSGLTSGPPAPSAAESSGATPAAAGAVPPAPVLRDSVVWFERNYRFSAASGIGRLAQHIRAGQRDAALATLRSASTPDGASAANGSGGTRDARHADPADPAGHAPLQWWDDPAPAPAPVVLQYAQQGFATYLRAVLQTPQDAAALARALTGFRVLCAHRSGARGMAALNAALDAHAQQVLLALLQQYGGPAGSAFYPGRPVMVLRNDPMLQLFNGDIGITVPQPQGQGALCVAFALPEGEVRHIPVQRLPEHQSAWAMTVHKAQGSEFDAVLVLLPQARSPVLTRELLYTAITRARQRVALAASAAVLASTLDTPTRRHSGLAARLREAMAAAPDPAPGPVLGPAPAP